jgi:hypothetical protein
MSAGPDAQRLEGGENTVQQFAYRSLASVKGHSRSQQPSTFLLSKLTLLPRDENTANYQQHARKGHEPFLSLSHITIILSQAQYCLRCTSSMCEAHALPLGNGTQNTHCHLNFMTYT